LAVAPQKGNRMTARGAREGAYLSWVGALVCARLGLDSRSYEQSRGLVERAGVWEKGACGLGRAMSGGGKGQGGGHVRVCGEG
jgi:hypothetical protein